MTIQIDSTILSDMLKQAQSCYPEESCGFIIGSQTENEKTVGRYFYPCNNDKEHYRKRRFLIDPMAYQTAEDQADAEGLSIISIVHSHPDHPDQPSDFDKQHAWPGLSYVIIAVKQGSIDTYHSWRLSDDRQHFELEPIHIKETLQGQFQQP
ncbi:MAG: hypothetical protein COA99_06975 [Moraxellaceae bacterium]|nr:MAG: hypothetical protein COA99_06975 [Moraxellaceae bacterium]